MSSQQLNMIETMTLEDELKAIPDADLVEPLRVMRERIGYSEDKWTGAHELIAREVLAEMVNEKFISIDPSVITPRMALVRKNKNMRKRPDDYTTKERLRKEARAFRQEQAAQGWNHLSEEYKQHLQSDRWRKLAAEYLELCDYRCDICGRSSPAVTLEIHHKPNGYRHLGNEQLWHLMCLCSEVCHPRADEARQVFRDEWHAKYNELRLE